MAELKDITNHDSILDQINQYHNLISLTADNLQDFKARIKELDSINSAQSKLYEALKALEID